jgi:hypothetical protein
MPTKYIINLIKMKAKKNRKIIRNTKMVNYFKNSKTHNFE